MSQAKLCGYDVNGWRDRVGRNWSALQDVEEGIDKSDEVYISDAVNRPSIVHVRGERSRNWVGGAQAMLAPHGLGGGWGDIGSRDHRRSVLALLHDHDASPDQLTAALTGLARGANFCAISINDDPGISERLQERLIIAASKGRVGRCLLVWRSVLAVLGVLSCKHRVFEPRRDLTVGFVGHVGSGFTLQRLRLLSESSRGRLLFAPERRQTAKLVPSDLGYDGLFNAATSVVRGNAPHIPADLVPELYSTISLALGHSVRAELIRTDRGDFLQVNPPNDLNLPRADLNSNSFGILDGCDVILFETLTSGTVRTDLLRELQTHAPQGLICLNEEVIAQGALEAARRYSKGDPVYFDFLPRISTIILGASDAENHDLVKSDEVLPAGKLYRSPKPARFQIQSNRSEFTVYLKKQLEKHPRKASVRIGSPVSKPVPVELMVEQAPALGRARILVSAPILGRKFTVDWDTAEEVDKSWDDLIVELGNRKVSIPNAIILPCGIEVWKEVPRNSSLFQLLNESGDRSEDIDWGSLSRKLSSRISTEVDSRLVNVYCISSNGDIPSEVPKPVRDKLKRLTELAMEQVKLRLKGKLCTGNGALQFLTWQFRGAPEKVPQLLLDAWDARLTGNKHPFIVGPGSWVLVYQGFGRTCRSQEDERTALSKIFHRDVEHWSYRVETAAMAFLLSRSDTAPMLLERVHVEKFAKRVIIEFREQLGTEYTKFHYAPFLLGGLIRWRLKVPNALVVGVDPLADDLCEAIDNTLDDFHRATGRGPKVERRVRRYLPLLEDLRDELHGQGKSPDILERLFNASMQG